MKRARPWIPWGQAEFDGLVEDRLEDDDLEREPGGKALDEARRQRLDWV